MKMRIGWLITVVAGLSGAPLHAQDLTLKDSAFEQKIEHLEKAKDSPWLILPYRPSYVIPVSYIQNPSLGSDVGVDPEQSAKEDDLQEVEVKFQFSLRLPVVDDLIKGQGELNFAYTQVSVWQAYNGDNSSPFRDTNYEPEMFILFDTDYEFLGLRGRLFSLGAVHQSNGRGSENLSRSWNRLYANVVLERGNFVCSIKPWWRIPEDEEEDNNPNIEDYLGYGELRAAYKWHRHVFAAMLRNNLDVDDNRGAIELDWTFPLTRQLKGFMQFFNGYGETLLTYNESDQRIGVGFLLADWL